MNLGSILLWGFGATVALTTCLAVSQGLGLSRMSMPLMLGAAFTGDRRRANLYGLLLHLANNSAGILAKAAAEGDNSRRGLPK